MLIYLNVFMLEGSTFEEAELDDGILDNYNTKLKDQLYQLGLVCMLDFKKNIITQNEKFGEAIIRILKSGGDINFYLNFYGYSVYDTFYIDEFDTYVLENDKLSSSIATGNVLIGFSDDYCKIVLAVKHVTVGESVAGIIH